MIDALVAGKLFQSLALRTGPSGKPFTSFLLSVSVGDEQPIIVSGIAFGEVAERIASQLLFILWRKVIRLCNLAKLSTTPLLLRLLDDLL